uniref:Uncharacterized protein n=1 Tax=Fagus sylvatica TaxID=28930 RepID=A0A2N9GGN3_FAGSY
MLTLCCFKLFGKRLLRSSLVSLRLAMVKVKVKVEVERLPEGLEPWRFHLRSRLKGQSEHRREELALGDDNGGEDSIVKGLDVHVGFIGLDDDDALAFGELIAFGFDPGNDLALGHGGAESRHEDLPDLRYRIPMFFFSALSLSISPLKREANRQGLKGGPEEFLFESRKGIGSERILYFYAPKQSKEGIDIAKSWLEGRENGSYLAIAL